MRPLGCACRVVRALALAGWRDRAPPEPVPGAAGEGPRRSSVPARRFAACRNMPRRSIGDLEKSAEEKERKR